MIYAGWINLNLVLFSDIVRLFSVVKCLTLFVYNFFFASPPTPVRLWSALNCMFIMSVDSAYMDDGQAWGQ